MKVVNFELEGKPFLGLVRGDLIVNLPLAIEIVADRSLIKYPGGTPRSKARHVFLTKGPIPESMIDLVGIGRTRLGALEMIVDGVVEFFQGDLKYDRIFAALESAKLLAPIPCPGEIICVGRNYVEHARERGSEIPAHPIFFLKSNNTICGPGEPIMIPPNSNQVDYEAELAVVIGKGGKNIPEDRAFEHVAGYTIMNDVSARDMQAADKQWFRGKSCDTFAPTGPWIVTKDEIPDPHGLRISLTLNGQTMQDSNTGKMIYSIPFLISYLSRSMTLEAGDILSTGTPEGVGGARTPPVFLKPGDMVSITIEKIGTLTNPIVAAQ